MKNQEHIPERISSAGRKLPFEVPESYFDSFPDRLQERLKDRDKDSRQTILRTLRPQLAIAAMFIGLLAVGYAGFRVISNQGESSLYSSEELTETLEYFAYELDDEMLISAIIESDISFSPQSSDLLEDEIIQYLSEEGIDISDLMID